MYNNFSSKKTKKVISALLASALVVTAAPITADAATTKVVGVNKTFSIAKKTSAKVSGLSKAEKKIVAVTISKNKKKVTVKGKKAGSATFKVGSKSYTVRVTKVTSIKKKTFATTLTAKKNKNVSVTVNGTNVKYDKVTWTSSNKKVVAVSKATTTVSAKKVASNTLKPLKKGTATITVKSKATGKKLAVKVTVKAATTPATTAPSTAPSVTPATTPAVSATPDATASATPATTPAVSADPSKAPEVSSTPSVSATPDASATPEVSSAPAVSATPEVSSAPAVSTTPEVSSAPAVSSNPAVSSTPDASETPVTPEVATVSGVKVVSAKAIEVTFNQPVTSASIVVKRGNALVSAEQQWNADKTAVTLVSTTKYIAGDYTVLVSGVGEASYEGKVTVEEQTVASVTITNDQLIKASNGQSAYFYYEIKDQYGDDITSSVAADALSKTVSTGTLSLDPENKKGTITYNFNDASAPQTVIVSLLHASTGKFANKTLTVSAAATLETFEFGDISYPENATRIYENTTGAAKIAFTAKDSYGNAIANPANDIQLVSSNNSLVTASFEKDATTDTYYININTSAISGTDLEKDVTITALGKNSNIVLQKSIKVVKAAAPAKVEFGSVDKNVVAVGDKAYVDITVYDQFDEVLTPDKYTGITFSKSGALANATVELVTEKTDANYGKVEIKTTGTIAGEGSIIASIGTTTFKKDITVKAARVVSSVAKADDVSLIQGASKKLAFTFKDQYGDAIETVKDNDAEGTSYEVTITKVTGDDNGLTCDKTSAVSEGDLNNITVTADASKTGKYTVTVSLKDANGTFANASTTVSVVSDVAEGLTYSIVDFEPLVADAAHTADGKDAYAQVVKVKAVDASGKEVVLPASKIQKVELTGTNVKDYVNISSSVIVTDSNDELVDAQEGNYVIAAKKEADDKAPTNAKVAVTINTSEGLKIVESNALTFTTEAPKAVELALYAEDPTSVNTPKELNSAKTAAPSFVYGDETDPSAAITDKEGRAVYLVQKDQYGVYRAVNTSESAVDVVVNTANAVELSGDGAKFVISGNKLVLSKDAAITNYAANKDITMSIVVGNVVKTFTVKFEKTVDDVAVNGNTSWDSSVLTVAFTRTLSAASKNAIVDEVKTAIGSTNLAENGVAFEADNKTLKITAKAGEDDGKAAITAIKAKTSITISKANVTDTCGNTNTEDVAVSIAQ